MIINFKTREQQERDHVRETFGGYALQLYIDQGRDMVTTLLSHETRKRDILEELEGLGVAFSCTTDRDRKCYPYDPPSHLRAVKAELHIDGQFKGEAWHLASLYDQSISRISKARERGLEVVIKLEPMPDA